MMLCLDAHAEQAGLSRSQSGVGHCPLIVGFTTWECR
jgi:hypothetical protein